MQARRVHIGRGHVGQGTVSGVSANAFTLIINFTNGNMTMKVEISFIRLNLKESYNIF